MGHGIDVSYLRDLDDRFRGDASYVRDREQYGKPEHWAVLTGLMDTLRADPEVDLVLQGDCEDFSLTVAAILAERYPDNEHDIRLVISATDWREPQRANHMDCVVRADDGRAWLVGSTMHPGLCPVTICAYRSGFLKFTDMTTIMEWWEWQ